MVFLRFEILAGVFRYLGVLRLAPREILCGKTK